MLDGNSTLEVEEGDMFNGMSTRKMEDKVARLFKEGRDEEAKEISRKVDNTRWVADLAVWRVMEKLNVVLIQEPGVLIGVEEDVQWIQKKLMRLGVIDGYHFTEELMDVAYDLEDVSDDLVLRATANQRGIGNWERCFLLIRIHKKLELIKSKIPRLPPACVLMGRSSQPRKYWEEMEWSPLFSMPTHNQLEINTAVSPLKKKLSALLDLKALHSDAKRKCRRVLDELEWLLGFLKGLESINLDDKAMVWMEKLSDVSLSSMVVIEDFINKNMRPNKRNWLVTSLEKLKSQKLAKEMDQLLANIQNLSISRPEAISQTRSILEPNEYDFDSFNDDHVPAIEEPDFSNFADDVHAMTTRLLAAGQSFRVIPIVGMRGIGKTTLAKLVFNNQAVVDHFPSRAWPSMAASSTIGDSCPILVDIIQQFIMHEKIAARIRIDTPERKEIRQKLKAFMTSNRALIVVDDSDDIYYRDGLLEVLGDASNGSRLIWISRKMSIPPILKTRSIDPHPLRLRADEECWALLTHVLKTLKITTPPGVEKMKEKILRTCEGLPLLIVKLADALSVSHKDTTIEEWSIALQQLSHDRDIVWVNTLSRINRDLSLPMRRCLLSLTLFPTDFDIPTRRLITLWVAEALLQTEGENDEAPEDVAERYLNLLIAHGMVQVTKKKLNGDVKTVRLPHALTQYWLSKAQKATTLGDRMYTRSELFPGNDMIRRLVDHLEPNDITFHHIHGGCNVTSSTTSSLTQHYRDVLSFRSFDSRKKIESEEAIGKFLGRCISRKCFLLLRVLDLENVYKPELPEALGELTQLRYFSLRSTFLEKLPPSISKLRKIQTLDIKHTNISTLPDSIWELQQLQHLYLSEGHRSKLKPRPSIGCLTTLRTLCGLFVDEETPVRDGLNRLLNLRKLELAMPSQRKAMSSQIEAVAEWVLNLKHLRSLRVKSMGNDYEAWDLGLKPLSGHLNLSCIYLFGQLRNPSFVLSDQFPVSLVDLTLSGSELVEDPMQSLDKLPNLRCLKLYAKSYIGKSMHCCRGGFPQLRVLKLWKLDQLEEWKVEKGALQALRELEIRYSERPPVVPEELSDRSPLLKIDVYRTCS